MAVASAVHMPFVLEEEVYFFLTVLSLLRLRFHPLIFGINAI